MKHVHTLILFLTINFSIYSNLLAQNDETGLTIEGNKEKPMLRDLPQRPWSTDIGNWIEPFDAYSATTNLLDVEVLTGITQQTPLFALEQRLPLPKTTENQTVDAFRQTLPVTP